MSKFRTLFAGTLDFVILLYPLAVYLGVQYIQPWAISASLLVFLWLRLFMQRAKRSPNYVLIMVGIVYCMFALWSDSLLTLRFYPVVINFCLLALFIWSLLYPPTIIERIARIQHPNLPEQGVIYTRKVTQVWCVFFWVNGSIAVATALWSSFEFWSLYNGLIAYILISLVMAVEYFIRVRTQAHVS